MRVMVVGSGGREHALAWKIAQSPLVEALFVAPGNGGSELVATNLPVDITDHAAVIAAARAHDIDFVVVGPDAQVVAGLGDDVRAAGITCFCPSKAAGQLEGSKSFTKALCDEFDIPTAAYGRFEDEASALTYLYTQGAPIVIKADGLAAGKGVTVAMSVEEAEEAIIDCFAGAFGASGAAVVIEEFMEGEEVSLFVLTDGEAILPGHAYLPPGGQHMRVIRDGARWRCRIDDGPAVNRHKPAVDVLFRSVAQSAGGNAVGAILTGMGDDGARGLLEMSQAGAPTLVQDEATSVVWGMPGAAMRLGAAKETVPLERIAQRLLDLAAAIA